MKFLLLVSLFIGNVFAKSELYQLQGNVGVSKNSRPIKFTLNWKENKGIAQGTYTDNFYSIKPTILRGIAGKNGRIFIATLPDIINGVKTISFLSSDLTPRIFLLPLTVHHLNHFQNYLHWRHFHIQMVD